MSPLPAPAWAATKFCARSARAASSLSHPNVCVIHARGTADDGRRFITMEYVEGSTLRERLSRADGPAGLREVLDVGIQIAAGACAVLGASQWSASERRAARASGGVSRHRPEDPTGARSALRSGQDRRHVGDVIQMRLQVTDRWTTKNEKVVIPTSQVVSGEVLN